MKLRDVSMPAREPAWWEVVAASVAWGVVLGAIVLFLLVTMIAPETMADFILGGVW